MLLDFAILGEKSKKGNFGMSEKELANRFTTEREQSVALQKRLDEYARSKIDLTIEMIKRAIKKKMYFRYVLADSWFACREIIQFIRFRHLPCDYLDWTSSKHIEFMPKDGLWKSYSKKVKDCSALENVRLPILLPK